MILVVDLRDVEGLAAGVTDDGTRIRARIEVSTSHPVPRSDGAILVPSPKVKRTANVSKPVEFTLSATDDDAIKSDWRNRFTYVVKVFLEWPKPVVTHPAEAPVLTRSVAIPKSLGDRVTLGSLADAVALPPEVESIESLRAEIRKAAGDAAAEQINTDGTAANKAVKDQAAKGVPDATTSAAGKSALATNAEAQAGSNSTKVVTPSALKAAAQSNTWTLKSTSFTADSTVRAAYFKTTSTSQHAATIYQGGTSGTGVALNVISDNPEDSAVYVTGTETGRGTLKITHKGFDDGSDASAAGLSIDLKGSGTAAQGIFITSSDASTKGNLLTIRNGSGSREFKLTSNGSLGIGLQQGGTVAARVHIQRGHPEEDGLFIVADGGGGKVMIVKDADGNSRLEINSVGNLLARGIAFFSTNIQVGGTSQTLGGGGSGVIGIQTRGKAPDSTPSGGLAFYVEGGNKLRFMGSDGKRYEVNTTVV